MTDPVVVSIVVCTRNRGGQLNGTLKSLAALTVDIPTEFILVDNASTDDTRTVILGAALRDERFRYFYVDRIGLGAGRDAAWREAKGDIVSFTDDDCYIAPDYVEQIVTVFAENPEAGVIGGRILLHDPSDAKITIEESEVPRHFPARDVIYAGAMHGANLSFRRSALQLSGGFDPNFGAGTTFPAEDIDAIAAVIWAGFQGRYDPRPTVWHHHGRKEKDVPALSRSYDAGRGAYWAKYMLRPESRIPYARHWLWNARTYSHPDLLGRVFREIRFAAKYARAQRRYAAIVVGAPVAAAVLLYVAGRAALLNGGRLGERGD